ncbi:hypothetical protein JQ570_21055 [Bradyrhizobium liaoningense]|nr:hypothetical protein [Bradyrhizobium liaoningense]
MPRVHEIGAGLVRAAHEQVDVRIVDVPVIGSDPVEPRAQIRFHLLRELGGERLEVGHLASVVLGRDDEAEMVAVVLAPVGKGKIVGAIGAGIEHDARGGCHESSILALKEIADDGQDKHRTAQSCKF